jgi:hypothetical protein
MSGAVATVGNVLGALQSLLGSRAQLRPASFRGVPFVVNTAGGTGGRRLITHEFPLRDAPYTEDLGALPRHFKLSAFVVDSADGAVNYIDARDALIAACETNGAAILVHPTIGEVSVRAGVLSWSERLIDRWGYCEFQLEFVVDGPQPSPLFSADTQSALLSGLASLLPIITAAYTVVATAVTSPALLLGQAVSAMTGLPPATVFGLGNAILACSATPANSPATALAVQTATLGMATNVIAASEASAAATDAVTGDPFTAPASGDPSGGLAGLAGFGGGLAAIGTGTPVGAAQAATQASVLALVQGSATAALIGVYAAINWPYASAATAARAQVLALVDAQLAAAAASGADSLYQAWQGLQQLAMADLIGRAQSLPQLASYVAPDTLPSLALAQRLYADPTQAGTLEALNDTPQPLFMPASGLALTGNTAFPAATAPGAAASFALFAANVLTANGAPITAAGLLLELA